MSDSRLTEASYIVLGLVEQLEPATPYDLKRLAARSTVNFWTMRHTQIYTESARLAEDGLLSEERELTGRKRRVYRITDAGRSELDRWRSDAGARDYEFRDVATLKLFFGADPKEMAREQVRRHTELLRNYESLLEDVAGGPPGWALALEHGIAHEQAFLSFWSRFEKGGD